MQRHIDIPGLINFRDLGGYKATDLDGSERQTLPGKLFRAGHFSGLTPEAQQALVERGVDTYHDLRSASELQKRPASFHPDHGPKIFEYKLDPGSGDSFQRGLKEKEVLDEQDMVNIMVNVNRSLVKDHSPTFRLLFDNLLQHDDTPLVIHCASGKDRTGLASALLLAALGVDDETIMADYLLTNQCLKADEQLSRAIQDFSKRFSAQITEQTLKPIYEVRPNYLQAALDEIYNGWGNIIDYLDDAIGVQEAQRRQLQQRYLQP